MHSVKFCKGGSIVDVEGVNRLFDEKIYFVIQKFCTYCLYGCETWSLTLRKERKLRMFENRVVRRIFGSKREGVTGEWRKLNNEELNVLYC